MPEEEAKKLIMLKAINDGKISIYEADKSLKIIEGMEEMTISIKQNDQGGPIEYEINIEYSGISYSTKDITAVKEALNIKFSNSFFEDKVKFRQILFNESEEVAKKNVTLIMGLSIEGSFVKHPIILFNNDGAPYMPKYAEIPQDSVKTPPISTKSAISPRPSWWDDLTLSTAKNKFKNDCHPDKKYGPDINVDEYLNDLKHLLTFNVLKMSDQNMLKDTFNSAANNLLSQLNNKLETTREPMALSNINDILGCLNNQFLTNGELKETCDKLKTKLFSILDKQLDDLKSIEELNLPILDISDTLIYINLLKSNIPENEKDLLGKLGSIEDKLFEFLINEINDLGAFLSKINTRVSYNETDRIVIQGSHKIKIPINASTLLTSLRTLSLSKLPEGFVKKVNDLCSKI